MKTLILKETILRTLETIREDIGEDIYEFLYEEWEL